MKLSVHKSLIRKYCVKDLVLSSIVMRFRWIQHHMVVSNRRYFWPETLLPAFLFL